MRWEARPAGEFVVELTEDVVGVKSLSGNPPRPLVRCRDCGKTNVFPSGRIVCTRFEQFHHYTPADGFCHAGERKEEQ